MFELALPWIFIALPLPIILWFLLPRVPVQLPAALRVPFFSALMGLMDGKQYSLGKPTHQMLLVLIWVLSLFALSGPRWVGEPLPVQREGHNIMLALDLSGSMELDDMVLHGRRVSRLAVVKRAAEQFVNDRKTDQIGLILFGTQAYLQTPLTYDHPSVLMRIEDATVGLAGNTTSIGDALGLAVKRLQDVPAHGRVIILLTDGVNNSGVLAPLKAAELAATEGIKIYTIGLGANNDPKLAEAYDNRAGVKSDLGDNEGAIRDYSRVIELNPENARAYCNRGIAKEKVGGTHGAIGDFDKSIEFHPEDAEAYFNRGVAKRQIGDIQGTIDDFNKAIELNPDAENWEFKISAEEADEMGFNG